VLDVGEELVLEGEQDLVDDDGITALARDAEPRGCGGGGLLPARRRR
jgi:hypothetical protein